MAFFLLPTRCVRIPISHFRFFNPQRSLVRGRRWSCQFTHFGERIKFPSTGLCDFSTTKNAQSRKQTNDLNAQTFMKGEDFRGAEEKLERMNNSQSDIPSILHKLAEEGTIDEFFTTFRQYSTEGHSLTRDECDELLETLAKRREWSWVMDLLAGYHKPNKPLPERGLRAVVSALREAKNAQRLMTLLQWCEKSGPLDVWYYNEALQLYASMGALRGMQLVCAHFRQLGVLPNEETTSIVVQVCQHYQQPELATKMLY